MATPPPLALGVNLPWRRYGCDFGTNAWRIGGLAAHDTARVRRALDDARRSGAAAVRWFFFCDGRAGIDYDAGGRPLGLQPSALHDVARALDLVGEAGLRLVPVLFDFHWARRRHVVNGVQLGGRSWILRDPVTRHHLTTRVIDPLLARVGHDPRILMWDLCNEPEWMAHQWAPPSARLARPCVRRWLSELAMHVHWSSPHPVTVGLASSRGLPLLHGVEVDVLQVHWYDQHQRRAPLERCPALPGRPRPVVLGEYPSAGSRRTVREILDAAGSAGYAAAWGWSLLAEDSATSYHDLLAAMREMRHA
jgi:hypothetical protein